MHFFAAKSDVTLDAAGRDIAQPPPPIATMTEPIQTIAKRAARRLLWARGCESAAVWAIGCGLLAGCVQTAALVTSAGAWWHWRAPLIMLACGAIVGFARAMLVGVTPRQAAAIVDGQRDLAARFATAVELTEAGRADEPGPAECVRQAAAALGDAPLAGVSFWRRSRRTAAALGLVIVGILTLGMLASWRESPSVSLAGLSPAQRAQVARDLRRRAATTSPGELQQALDAAAVAVEMVDEDQLARLLAELRDEGIELIELTPEQVRQALGLAEEAAPTAGGDDGIGAESAESAATASGNGQVDPAGGVKVYDPLFAAAVEAAADGAPPSDAATRGPAIDYADAWDRARQRAMASLQRGDVPPAYRDIVRRYFAD